MYSGVEGRARETGELASAFKTQLHLFFEGVEKFVSVDSVVNCAFFLKNVDYFAENLSFICKCKLAVVKFFS